MAYPMIRQNAPKARLPKIRSKVTVDDFKKLKPKVIREVLPVVSDKKNIELPKKPKANVCRKKNSPAPCAVPIKRPMSIPRPGVKQAPKPPQAPAAPAAVKVNPVIPSKPVAEHKVAQPVERPKRSLLKAQLEGVRRERKRAPVRRSPSMFRGKPPINGKAIERLKGIGTGRVLVVIAAGPSVLEVDFSPLKEFSAVDFMCINKPFKAVWPSKFWAFCDHTQQRANQDTWNSYDGIIINSPNVRARKSNQVLIRSRPGKGFCTDVTKGYHIGRSSTYANMQVAYYMNYDRVYIFGCLPDGERILTNRGMVPIDNLDDNDLIYSTSGFKPFVATSRRWYDGTLYSLKTSMNNSPLRVTGEHPILLRDREFVNAEDVRVGDYCKFPIDRTEVKSEYSTDFWWLLGLYAAEGYTRLQSGKYRYAVFCLGKHESDLADKLTTTAGNLGWKVTSSRLNEEGRTSHELILNTKDFGEFVDRHLGKGARYKFLSDVVMTADLDSQRAFLHGYLEGDGSLFFRKKRKIHGSSFSTASESLAEGIQKMLLRLNIISCVTKSKRPSGFLQSDGSYGTRYYVYLVGKQLDKFADELNLEVTTTGCDSRFSYIEDDYLYTRIIKISAIEIAGYVNNIEVQDGHSYGARLIMTHNCDMGPDPKTGALHHYGQNPDVTNENRKGRFPAEAKHYLHAAQILPKEVRDRFIFCSSWNTWEFTKYFPKLDHLEAVRAIGDYIRGK